MFMRNYSRLVNSMPICYMKQRILFDEKEYPTDYVILELNTATFATDEFPSLFSLDVCSSDLNRVNKGIGNIRRREEKSSRHTILHNTIITPDQPHPVLN